MTNLVSLASRTLSVSLVLVSLIVPAWSNPWTLKFSEVDPSTAIRVDLSFRGTHSELVVLPYLNVITSSQVYLMYWQGKAFTTEQGDCWISGYTAVPPGSHAAVMFVTQSQQWAWYYGFGQTGRKFGGKPSGAVLQCVLSS